jgi:hypothetical protein
MLLARAAQTLVKVIARAGTVLLNNSTEDTVLTTVWSVHNALGRLI